MNSRDIEMMAFCHIPIFGETLDLLDADMMNRKSTQTVFPMQIFCIFCAVSPHGTQPLASNILKCEQNRKEDREKEKITVELVA